MTTIIGMIIAVLLLIFAIQFMGPYAIAVLFVLVFGLIFSIHQRNRQIYEDVKLIREKLELLREEEKTQIEMKNRMEEAQKATEDSQFASELNKEIESELERYIEQEEKKKDHKE